MSLFTEKAPPIMVTLMTDFGLTKVEAAAILGNIGHECGGFLKFQEQKPSVPGSKGGFGWCQWTGPRRTAFEAYCKRNDLDPKSDRANYGFLFVELTGTEKRAIPALKSATGIYAKVKAFEAAFERAGVKHYASRNTYADEALAAYEAMEEAGKLVPLFPAKAPSTPTPDRLSPPPPPDIPVLDAEPAAPAPEAADITGPILVFVGLVVAIVAAVFIVGRIAG